MSRGRGHALTVLTGSKTHITLVYFFSLGEQDKQTTLTKAQEYCDSIGKSDTKLEVGDMWGGRSIKVVGEFADLKSRLTKHFEVEEDGYTVDTTSRGNTPHIDLKGQDKDVLLSSIDLSDSSVWKWM